jgi:hypothetical protein
MHPRLKGNETSHWHEGTAGIGTAAALPRKQESCSESLNDRITNVPKV